ncbi:MAG TPA: GNAT family N-acetyltransferase [bacterium]|nr:GNAT family N-acetyltransferase [bacterium]
MLPNRRIGESMSTRLRKARTQDAARAAEVVRRAYEGYVPRMGTLPGPMRADYQQLVARGVVYVLEDQTEVVGVLVLVPHSDHLLLDTVAVDPDFQGRGHGRRLISLAEAEARSLSVPEVRLYTNVVMVENLGLYAHLGFEETHRAEQDGHKRVFMRKRL